MKEAAAALGLHPRTLTGHIKAGNIAAVRLGPGSHAPIRISRGALDAFVRPLPE